MNDVKTLVEHAKKVLAVQPHLEKALAMIEMLGFEPEINARVSEWRSIRVSFQLEPKEITLDGNKYLSKRDIWLTFEEDYMKIKSIHRSDVFLDGKNTFTYEHNYSDVECLRSIPQEFFHHQEYNAEYEREMNNEKFVRKTF